MQSFGARMKKMEIKETSMSSARVGIQQAWAQAIHGDTLLIWSEFGWCLTAPEMLRLHKPHAQNLPVECKISRAEGIFLTWFF